MTKKKFNEEKIIKVLQEKEGDIPVRNFCMKHQISEQTFYRWWNKFGNITVLEVRRLKELEQENKQLKQIVADMTLDNRILRDVNQNSGEAIGAPSNGGISQIQLSGQ